MLPIAAWAWTAAIWPLRSAHSLAYLNRAEPSHALGFGAGDLVCSGFLREYSECIKF